MICRLINTRMSAKRSNPASFNVVKEFRPPLMRNQKGTAKVAIDVIDAFGMNPAGFNNQVAPKPRRCG